MGARDETKGYRPRGRLVKVATGASAAGVALIMVLSAAAFGAVIHAPYKGAVSPFNDQYTSGCATAKAPKAFAFSLKTGTGGTVANAASATCASQYGGVGSDSYADEDGGADVAVTVPIGTGQANVSAAINATWSGTLSASDGGSPTCNAHLYTFNYQDSFYEWNISYGSFGYQENYTDDYNGQVYSYSYLYNGPNPGLMFTNNTYFDWYHEWGADSFCEAGGTLGIYINAGLQDLTNGTYIPIDNASYGGTGYGEHYTFLEVYNETDWFCYNETYWYGPSSYWGNTSLTCYNFNTTLTSVISNETFQDWGVFSYSYTSSTGASNSVSLTTTGSWQPAIWWWYDFNGRHHYALVFDVESYEDTYAENFAHGSAKAVMNFGTLGNGVKLKSITT